MATKNERAIATALGLVVGYCGARLIINKVGLEGTEKNKFLATFALAVGGLGYVSSEIFGTPNDTVNYFLLNEANNIVYDGVAFEHRIEKREYEHKRDGKEFSEMVYDFRKARTDALKLEKKLIKINRGIYNIQHNSDAA